MVSTSKKLTPGISNLRDGSVGAYSQTRTGTHFYQHNHQN